ncbi:glycosyltransferase family 61 protein, partial [bacterium]|nr:glycosyltransferase family 61 protein [bacterium]
ICRVLFRMGELGLCNEVLTDYYSHGSCQSPKDFLRFVKIRPYTDKFPEAGQRHNFMPAAQMSFQGPVVFGQSPGTRSYELTIPPLDVLTFYDVDVIGANQIIQDDNLIVVDPAANPASGFVAGSWPFVGGTSSDPDQAMVWFPFERKQILERAILLNGRCSSNYFHFLIEYLPRSIAFLKSPSAFDKMPLIVESSLPSQFFEAIQIIFGKDKSLFYRDDFVTLRVKELFTPSYQTYLPDSLDIPFWQGGGFSKTCLEFIRAQVGTALGISFHTPHTGPENKIFLSRAKVKNRTIINQKEIETAFEQKGYKIIFVEELSFREQVYLFSNATHIAGQAGAALANLIFCRPGTKVIALIAQQNSDYVLPANLAREFGSDLIYVTGEHLRPRYSYPSDSLYIHSGFKVSLSKIRDLLKSLDY